MKIHEPYIIYEDEKHKFVWLGLDESEAEKGILTNQYLIVHNNTEFYLTQVGISFLKRFSKTLQSS
jgi:flavorubredoxin